MGVGRYVVGSGSVPKLPLLTEIRRIEAALVGYLVDALHLRTGERVELRGMPGRVLIDPHQRLLDEDLALGGQGARRHHSVTLPIKLLHSHDSIVEERRRGRRHLSAAISLDAAPTMASREHGGNREQWITP